MLYGVQNIDPLQIFLQIATVQLVFYASFIGLVFMLIGSYVKNFDVAHAFQSDVVSTVDFLGIMYILATLINAIPTSLAIYFCVGRAKRCMDFGCTAYVIHTILVTIISKFPTTIIWWAVHILACVIAVQIAEILSARQETQDIPLGGGASRSRARGMKLPSLWWQGDGRGGDTMTELASLNAMSKNNKTDNNSGNTSSV